MKLNFVKMKKIKLGIAAWKMTPIITNEELNLDCVIKCDSDFHDESLKQFGSCSECGEWIEKK